MIKSEDSGNKFLEFIEDITSDDAQGLLNSHKSYHNSWKRRGGVGAFMMLARKWDRFEARCAEKPQDGERYDVFHHVELDSRPEGLLDDIRDLRRYLCLVESELAARGVVTLGNHRDNQIDLPRHDHTGKPGGF